MSPEEFRQYGHASVDWIGPETRERVVRAVEVCRSHESLGTSTHKPGTMPITLVHHSTVKLVLVVEAPPGVVTVTGPLAAAAGTAAIK
jgi:hypothetical protein